MAATYFTYDANGHPQTKQQLVATPSNYLTTTYGYTNGLLTSITEPNSATTTFSNFVCNGVLPTTIKYDPSTGLSKSVAWSCDGGVLTSSTDENGKLTQYGFIDSVSGAADPFWRVLSVTDPLSNVTDTHYIVATSSTAATQESVLTFNNGNSTVDNLVTFDSLGRVHVNQNRHSPTASNYDSVETDYDVMGRPYLVTMPYSNTVGVACPAPCPSTQTVYDLLNRPTSVTDAGNGSIKSQYPSNDVLTTLGPPPAGENPKSRQVEYDGLGRVTSVCEILAGGGSSCNQSSTGSGYKTSYSYSTPTAGGSQTVVTQGAQSRTYVYDGLGRLTSETNPESGTTKYIYDTTTGPCFGTSAGDLAESIDSSGAHICYYYDDLHRVFQKYTATSSGVISNCRNFNYGDYNITPPSGITTNNVNGRVVNANVVPDCNSPISVDEWFSYDANGRATDVWESTPHSGGYYHTTEGYWANNAIQSLGGIPGYTTINYGVDGEGRPSTAQQGTTKIVCDSTCSQSSTTFDSGGNPRVVNIGGTSDNDTYTYDPNTGRMNSYTFTVGATPNSTSGGLTWNQNGTLRQLAITDGFNAGGTQACNFGTSTVMGYDDLGRLLNANCGSLWSQSFSYDQYSNITKAGSISWACASCYNGKNQYNTAISSLISYDANGRLLDDSFHKYTWDGYGNLSTITGANGTITCGTSGICLTYDAFGRMVEKNVSGTYTEVLYSPVGKTAIMQGQTTTQAYLPLPAGETLFAGGPTGTNRFFWHKDWLGTVRLSSAVAARTIAYDRAFAPFGERYANFGGTINPDFTGDTADTISDLFDTQNREYHATQGRWLTPDPAGIAAVDITNPQSWNRYAYVLNNPLANVDPLGLCGGDFDCPDDWGFGSFGGMLTRSDLQTLFDMPNNGSPIFRPGANGLFSGQDCLACWSLGPSPMDILQQVLAGNLTGALQSVGVLPDYSPGWILDANNQMQQNSEQQCLNGFNNSWPGKFVNFFSFLSPLWGPNRLGSAKEDVVGPAAKYLAYKTLRFLQNSPELISGPEWAQWSSLVAGASAEVTEWAAKDVVLPLSLGATATQFLAHMGCHIAAYPNQGVGALHN